MDQNSIAQRFEAAIKESVAAAGARLEPDVQRKLSRLAERAAVVTVHLTDEDHSEGAIAEGVDAFKKLIEKMVKYAKMMGSYPVLDDGMLRAAFTGNPPLWEGSDIDRLG